MKSTGVFISYRRAGGIETARNIHDRLTHLGFDVFMDLASMRRGKFNTQIYDEIEKADNFVLVLSKDSLNRCAETDDWVRLELEHAINHNKNIILVSKTDFQGFPSDLPESISEIRYIDLTPISEEYYEAFFLRLTERLIFSSSKNRKIIRKSIEKRRHAEYKKSADNEPKIKPLFSYPGALSIEESYATIPTKNRVFFSLDVVICLILFFICRRNSNFPHSTIPELMIALGIFVRISASIQLCFKDCRAIFSIIASYLLCFISCNKFYFSPLPFLLRTKLSAVPVVANIIVNGWLFYIPLLVFGFLFFKRELLKRNDTIKQLFLSPFNLPWSKYVILLIGALFLTDIISMSKISPSIRIFALSSILYVLFRKYQPQHSSYSALYLFIGVCFFNMALAKTGFLRIVFLVIQVGAIGYAIYKNKQSLAVPDILKILYAFCMSFALLISSCGYLPYSGVNASVNYFLPSDAYDSYSQEKIIGNRYVGFGVRNWAEVTIPPEFTYESIYYRNTKNHIEGDGELICALELMNERGKYVIYDAKQKCRLSNDIFDGVTKFDEEKSEPYKYYSPIYVLKKGTEVTYGYFFSMKQSYINNLCYPYFSDNLGEIKKIRNDMNNLAQKAGYFP